MYDSDGNGKVTFDDVLNVMRDLTGSFMSEQQRQVGFLFDDGCIFLLLIVYCYEKQKVLMHVFEEAGYKKDSFLVLSDFTKVSYFTVWVILTHEMDQMLMRPGTCSTYVYVNTLDYKILIYT